MREAEQAIGFDARNHIAHFVMCLGSEELGDHVGADSGMQTTLRLLRARIRTCWLTRPRD